MIAFLSATGYALIPTLLKKANQQIKPFTVMAISMAVLFTISLLMSLFVEKSYQIKFSECKQSIGILILIGVINACAFWLMIKAFPYMPIWQQTLFNLLGVVIASVFAVFILGEAFNPKLFLALLIMSVGLWVARS
jgi:drug/metabolite transporter (DMT)-like permease